jgi:hypothetical protein
MRRIGLTLLLSAMLPLLLPVHASAFWRWLDELSGPGPFNGAEFDTRLYCFAKVAPRASNDTQTGEQSYRYRDGDNVRTFALPGAISHCMFGKVDRTKRRYASFNLPISYQRTHRTNLEFDEEPDLRRRVNVFSLRPAFWIRPARSVEVGAGFGYYRFWGTRFDGFNRVSVEPLQFDVKPVALIRDLVHGSKPLLGIPDSQYDQIISLRTAFIVFPQGFSAEDFRARPGTFNVDVDKLWTFSVMVDLEPIFRSRKEAKRPN